MLQFFQKFAPGAGAQPITADELKSIIDDDSVLVVDVRNANEVAASGKIPGALQVPAGMIDFQARPGTPTQNAAFSTDKTIVLYCASGARSAMAAKALLDMGYSDVRNLGPFGAWLQAGGAVERI